MVFSTLEPTFSLFVIVHQSMRILCCEFDESFGSALGDFQKFLNAFGFLIVV